MASMHDMDQNSFLTILRVPLVIMNSVVDAQREILLDPIGSNVWSGQQTQALNSAAVTWSLAKELYGFTGPYWVIPMSLLFGMIPTLLQWLIHKVSNSQCTAQGNH